MQATDLFNIDDLDLSSITQPVAPVITDKAMVYTTVKILGSSYLATNIY